MRQHEHDVLDGLSDGTLLRDLELLAPVLLLFDDVEVCVCLGHPVGHDLRLCAFVLRYEVRHRLVARAGVRRRVGVDVLVKLAEAVEPDEVPRVAELTARGVGCVV